MENFGNPESKMNSDKDNIQEKNIEAGFEGNLFREYFSRLGYKEHESLSLSPPESDQTVPFVGSSVNAFKEYLKNRKDIETPASILQPCIRTQDIIHGYDISKIPFGMPFFHIHGTFSPKGSYEKTAKDVIGYLRDAYQIINEDILIKPTVPERSEELLKPFVAVGVQVEVDHSKYYEWKYGLEGISGRGVTLFIRHQNGEWWDVGNIVSISDENNQEIAVEFGVGSEFFQAAVYGHDDPFESSRMSKIVHSENPIHKKVLTYLEVALSASGTIKEKRTRTIRMTNRYINVAYYLCQVHGYSRQEVENIANAYKNITTVDVDVEYFLRKFDARSQVFEGLESLFVNFTQNPVYLDEKQMKNQMHEYLKKNGIRNEELILYIEKNHKDNSLIQELCKKL